MLVIFVNSKTDEEQHLTSHRQNSHENVAKTNTRTSMDWIQNQN